eukprot:m51a1_g4757 hypothetical protein (505) ;mRNA; r:429960-431474
MSDKAKGEGGRRWLWLCPPESALRLPALVAVLAVLAVHCCLPPGAVAAAPGAEAEQRRESGREGEGEAEGRDHWWRGSSSSGGYAEALLPLLGSGSGSGEGDRVLVFDARVDEATGRLQAVAHVEPPQPQLLFDTNGVGSERIPSLAIRCALAGALGGATGPSVPCSASYNRFFRPVLFVDCDLGPLLSGPLPAALPVALLLSGPRHAPGVLRTRARRVRMRGPRPRRLALCTTPMWGPLPGTAVQQWVAYHALLGVDALLVYDRDGEHGAFWGPYLRGGLVRHYRNWTTYSGALVRRARGYYDEIAALSHCMWRAAETADWALYLSLDEFAHSPAGHRDLARWLQGLGAAYDYVALPMVSYSPAGDPDAPYAEGRGLLIEQFTRRSNRSANTKVAARPALCQTLMVHMCDGARAAPERLLLADPETLRVNHYRNYRGARTRGPADNPDATDTGILWAAPLLRAALQRPPYAAAPPPSCSAPAPALASTCRVRAAAGQREEHTP